MCFGRRKEEKKGKGKKNKKTEQAVEGKGGVKMVWYGCIDVWRFL